jgi:clan AA aspartic protease (TIGR02281 family)
MVGELIRDQSGLYYVETQRDRGLVTMLARSACNQVAALTPTPDVVPAPTPTPAPAPLSPAEKKRQAAQAQNEAAKALAEAARLEAETARIKIEAEAEAIRRKEELAAKLERDKAEQAAKLERDKAEHDARLARERAEWEDKLNILLGSKTEFERIAIPLKIRGNSMRLNVGLGDQVLTMLLDTGATSSLITNALASSLIKDEHARYIGMTEFKTASGEIVKAKEIIINEVKIGDQVVRDVRASVVPGDVELLLGLNVLNKFGLYAIDSRNSQLIFTAKKEKAVAVKEEG